MDSNQKFSESVKILKSHHLRQKDDDLEIYKEFPYLLDVGKTNIEQKWSSKNPTEWIIKDFRVFIVYLCKQGVVVQTEEFLPTKSFVTETNFIEWQGGVRYSLHMERNEIKLLGIHYGATGHIVKYDKTFIVNNELSYRTIVVEITNLFYNLCIQSKCIFFPCLTFSKRDFPIFEKMIYRYFGNIIFKK